MKEQIKERIEQLKAEYESGQKMLADLEIQESNREQVNFVRTNVLSIVQSVPFRYAQRSLRT